MATDVIDFASRRAARAAASAPAAPSRSRSARTISWRCSGPFNPTVNRRHVDSSEIMSRLLEAIPGGPSQQLAGAIIDQQ